MDELKLLEPYPMFGGPPFPDSTEAPDGVISVTWKDAPAPMADVIPNVVYQELSGEKQRLQIFKPAPMFLMPGNITPPKYPLIVYVPGSAWHRQNVWMGLGKALAAVAKGYAFAIVEYRPSDIAPFPAQIEDAKSAIRYLRIHADEYSIDKTKVAIWGDSSGGHTAAFTGITGDHEPDSGQYNEETCAVNCVVDWFGPTDISLMNYYPTAMDHHGADSPEGFLLGGKNVLENPELAQKANPLNYLSKEKPVPPFLIMHGSKDNVVPFNQSVRLYEKLCRCGKAATFYKLEGGGHGMGGFNSPEALEILFEFFGKYLGPA
jgi:acetyl esterase/lipase